MTSDREIARTRPVFWSLLLSALWIAGVAYVALQSWPHLPMDMPARDPQVQAALARAVNAHLLKHALIALVPAALLLVVVALARQRGVRTR